MTCSYIPDSLPVLNSSYKELILVAFIQAMHKTKTQTENSKIVHVNKKEYQRKVTTLKLFTSYCRYSRLQKVLQQASWTVENYDWFTTYESCYLSASACPSSWFKHNKSIVVFHCSACLLQDFCNLLYRSVGVQFSDSLSGHYHTS